MRTCPFCQHENASHIALCARCGRRLVARTGHTPGPIPIVDGPTPAPSVAGVTGPVLGGGLRVDEGQPAQVSAGPAAPFAAPGPFVPPGRPAAPATSNAGATAVGGPGSPSPATPPAAMPVGAQPAPPSQPWWALATSSVGYVFRALRGRLDAPLAIARLRAEVIGDDRLLAGARDDLGSRIRDDGRTLAPLSDVQGQLALVSSKAAAARLAGARDAAAEAEVARLTQELGRLAARLDLGDGDLGQIAARVVAMERALTARRAELAAIEVAMRSVDTARLALGIGILGAGLVILIVLLRALVG